MKDTAPNRLLVHVPRNAGRIARLAFLRGEHGSAFVEFALLVPMFTTMLLGASEYARMSYAAIEVSHAASAGVHYGAQNHMTAMNTSAMQSAATNDAPEVTSISAVASTFCTCSNGTTITCANAAANCSARILEYVSVTTTASINPLFHLPLTPTTYTVTSTAQMRVEQ